MNGHENQSFPSIFKGLQECTRHHKKCGALPNIKPYPLPIRFHGVRSLTRKENSSQGFCWCLWVQLRYRKSGLKGPEYPRSSSGILTQFPFDKWHMIGHFETAVYMELFSISLFKVLIWIFATATKICTRGCFTKAYVKGFTTTSYLSKLCYLVWRLCTLMLDCHPFSGLVDLAGVLLHIP